MSHNIYINIILSTDIEEFPNEYGAISNIKKEIRKTIVESSYKLKRYNFDIVSSEYDTENINQE